MSSVPRRATGDGLQGAQNLLSPSAQRVLGVVGLLLGVQEVPASSSSPLLQVPSPFVGVQSRARPSRSRVPPPHSPAAIICLHQPKPAGLQKELLKSSPKKPAAISTK